MSFTTRADLKDVDKLTLQLFPGAELATPTRGQHGYRHEQQIVHGNLVLGWVDWGADHGWHWVYIGGAGLRYRRARGRTDDMLPDEVRPLAPRWGRVDIALDVYDPETYSVAQAMIDYEAGDFMSPKARVMPWTKTFQSGSADDEAYARTFYVGKRENGKQVRVYDKGRQVLGSMTVAEFEAAREKGLVPCEAVPYGANVKDWVRLELEYRRSKERPLSDAEILRRDETFAGAWPALARVLGVADGRKPAYIPDDEDVEVAWLVQCAKDSYGGLIKHLVDGLGWDAERIIEAVKGDKKSRRISTIRENYALDG